MHIEKPFDKLVEIMRVLRGPDGCPWDKEQDSFSIRGNLLEESYELYEAICDKNDALMAEELGDVLLQVVFHSQIAQDDGRFTVDDVIEGICGKLIERHPHVFGDVKVSGSGEVLSNWESIKKSSKGQVSGTDTLKAVSSALPALMKANKLISRAKKGGFPFPETAPVLSEEALGDELFNLALSAKLAGIDPELALLDRCKAFIEEYKRWEEK